ncbi:MAG: hypothetical protein NT007_03755 [Candidatus Kapabacteria bacterium]|nr:hypothetical protein [Candidatus Kapabacteria bacterium]
MIDTNIVIINNSEHQALFQEINQSNKQVLNRESKKNFKWWVQYLFFMLISKNKNNFHGKINVKDLKRILLYRNDGIGDYILSNPIISLIKSQNPEVKFDVITSERNDSFVKKDTNIDKTFILTNNNKSEHKSLYKLINLNNYDFIFVLNSGKTTAAAILLRNIQTGVKVIPYHHSRYKIYNQVFDFQVQISNEFTHWMKKMIEFPLQTVNFLQEVEPNKFPPYIFFPVIEIEPAKQLILKYNLKYILKKHSIEFNSVKILENCGQREYFIYNISAFTIDRNLPISKNISFLKILSENFAQDEIFVSGSPDDYYKIDEIVSSFPEKNVKAFKSGLFGLVAFICGAKGIISPDTATVHIAAAAKVPVLGFYQEFAKLFMWYPFDTDFVLIANKRSLDLNYLNDEIFTEALNKFKAIL